MFNLNNENSKKLITITGNQATGMSRKGLSRLYIDLFPHAVHYGTTNENVIVYNNGKYIDTLSLTKDK